MTTPEQKQAIFNKKEIEEARQFIGMLADMATERSSNMSAIPPDAVAGYRHFGESLLHVKILTTAQLEKKLLEAAAHVPEHERNSLVSNLRSKFVWAVEQEKSRVRSPA